MIQIILRRLAQMLAIMFTVSLILFVIFDSDTFKKTIAYEELGGFAVSALSDSDYHAWLVLWATADPQAAFSVLHARLVSCDPCQLND